MSQRRPANTVGGPARRGSLGWQRGATRSFLVLGFIAAGLAFAGCGKPPTRQELLSREVKALHCYCASNAAVAETALLECARYVERCRQAGVEGIQYDEVLARTYGRLYLVARRLGHHPAAEQYLACYARVHARLSPEARRAARPCGEMERLIRNEYDGGLQTTWKTP